MKRFSTIFQVVVVLALVLGGVACAQSTATLTGTVSDPTGAMVTGAAVKVHSLDTNADREVTTDSSGVYVVPSLLPGNYMVQVTATGFGTFTMQKLELTVDQRATVNVKLNVASTGETVEVTGAAPIIDASTITVGQVIDKTTVQEIPLNGRHFLDLTVLTPGGVTAPQNGNLTSPSRGLGANSFITAGNREDSVNFQINGVNLNDMSQNQITFQPSINTTSEFKINNSTYSAEYGRSSGSIVNVSTRSGTNAFHGEAFDYFRNNGLDARNYFNPKGQAQGALKRNNFGGAIGGPIWRDKTFFFLSYEGLIQHQGLPLNSPVLTASQRAQVLAVGNPASVALLPLIPVANDATGNNFLGTAPGPVTVHQGTADGLQQFGTKDTLHGFYAFQSDNRSEPNLQNNTVPGFGDHRNAHRQVLTLNETHVFSPKLVNEARLGFNRINIAFTPTFQANPNDYHISDGVNAAIGLPQMTIADLAPLNFGGPSMFPQGRTDTLGIFSDTATYLTGKHTLKFGGEYRRFLAVPFTTDTGTVGFNTTANFIKGVANTFTITPSTVSSRVYVNAIGGFVQDSYRIVPNLTLELGFRFEWNGTPTEGENRFVVFDPATVSLVRVGTNGLHSVYNQNYNWEPRVGFAYDVFSTGRTVIRGGYGYMADQPTSNAVTGLAGNTPFASPVAYTSSAAPIPLTNLYGSAAAAGLTINTIDHSFKNGYSQSFNVNLQQELPWGVAVQVGYFGSVGRHLRARRNLNQPVNGVRPYLTLSNSSPIAPGAAVNSNFIDVTSVGSSNYNALWLTGRKNVGHGLQFNATYNWSKSMDLNSLGSQGVYVFQDSNNPASNYGLSDYDVRNRLAANAIYDLPFKGNRFIEGFRVSGIAQWQSGNPMNIINSAVLATVNGLTGTTGTVRPNLVAPIVTKKTRLVSGNVGWISSTLCPGVVATGGCSFVNVNAFGNLRRNAGTGPGFADVDLSLEKNTKLTERLTLQLRADAFDVFNHPSFGQPALADTSKTFGQITTTRFAVSDLGSSRQLQLAGKFLF